MFTNCFINISITLLKNNALNNIVEYTFYKKWIFCNTNIKKQAILMMVNLYNIYFWILEMIALISTCDLKSNCKWIPFCIVINNSLSISINPAVSIP